MATFSEGRLALRAVREPQHALALRAVQHGRCRNPRDANFRPGDWYCQCGNYNLYWRLFCNRGKCGMSRAGGL